MVDLVKIRKKAKEKKESEDTMTVPDSPGTTESEEMKAPANPRRKVSSKKSEPDKPVSKGDVRPKAKPKGKPEAEPKPKPKPQPPADVPVELESSEQIPEPEPVESGQGPTVAESETPEKVEPVEEVESVSVDATATGDEPAQPPPDPKSLDRLAKFKQEAGRRRSWTTDATKIEAPSTSEEESNEFELLRFKLAGEEYAVDIENIVEIVPPRGTTRVPNADGAIVGIMSLRGTIVTVFDLRSKLGHPPVSEEPHIDPRMIVVERDGETAGFLVDRVSRVVKLDPSELENHPVVSAAEQSDYVDGVFQSTDGLVILLDLEKILASKD